MRRWFWAGVILLLMAGTGLFYGYGFLPVVHGLMGLLLVVALYDYFQRPHTILRNFPLLGHFRYAFEFISPEIQQYFIERNTDGKPFSRNERALAYQRAKNVIDTRPFGTQLELNLSHYEGIRHSMFPVAIPEEVPRVRIGGPACQQPYKASLLNISAMSYGALSSRAIHALNRGARMGHFYHNTGEGGLSDYHLQEGGDLVWQIGTGYFGCRTDEGAFDPEAFQKTARLEPVKMIEIKLSQGAKPGHGGVLPAQKNTPEIARIRKIKPYETVFSPPAHSAFQNPEGLMHFVQKLRALSGGKPVGFKLCLGRAEEFLDLCKAMKKTGIQPDFITVDGAEGGTGAAPMEFADSVGLPLQPALIFVHQALEKNQLREHIRLIASGKVISGAGILKALALGADLCHSARGFMFALGCIQALRCNSNDCPTGVATQRPGLERGLDVKDKAQRVAHFHRNTLHAAMELMAASGVRHPGAVSMDIFLRGDEFVEMENRYFPDSLNV